MISLEQYESKKRIHPPTNHQPEPVTITLEPMEQNPNDEIQRLKVEIAILKEREAAKQSEIQIYQNQIKSQEERYVSLKKSMEEEIERVRNEVTAQERRYQQRLEEDLTFERQRSEEERQINRELLQRMMKLEEWKRRRDDDSTSSPNNREDENSTNICKKT